MAGSGGREVRREVAIHPVAETDQDARGEPRLRLGHGPVESVGGPATEAFERGLERPLRRKGTQTVRAQRADRTDPREVGTVVIGRRRADPTAELDAIPRDERRIPRQGGRHDDRRLSLEQHDGGTGPCSWRTDALDHRCPGAVSGRDCRCG